MRVTQITSCNGNGRDRLKGFVFRLSDPNDSSKGFIDLPIMGKTGSDDASTCYTDNVLYDVTSISATINNKGFVNSLQFGGLPSDSLVNSSGDRGHASKTWNFSQNPVVAFYGKTNSNFKIEQLGWITLNTEC